MRLFCFLSIPFLIWLSTPASARMYQYTDKNGVVHFTNSLSKIPDDQLPNARPIGGEVGHTQPEAGQETSEKKDPAPGEEKTAAKGAENGEEIEQGQDAPFVEDINKEKAALDAEHARLEKAKKALQKERDTLKIPEQVKAYQKRVRELNKAIDAYEKRNRAFQKKVDAFNAALKEDGIK